MVFARSHTEPLFDVPSHTRPVVPGTGAIRSNNGTWIVVRPPLAATLDTSAMLAPVTGWHSIGREVSESHVLPVHTSIGRLNVDVPCVNFSSGLKLPSYQGTPSVAVGSV